LNVDLNTSFTRFQPKSTKEEVEEWVLLDERRRREDGDCVGGREAEEAPCAKIIRFNAVKRRRRLDVIFFLKFITFVRKDVGILNSLSVASVASNQNSSRSLGTQRTRALRSISAAGKKGMGYN
jgi:hypothetical protein